MIIKPQNIKQNLTELKIKLGNATIIKGDDNTFSEHFDNKLENKKISLNTTYHLNLISIYKTLHKLIAEYTFFVAHGIFTKISNISP